MRNYELNVPNTLLATGLMSAALVLGPGHGDVPEVRFPASHSVESETTVNQVGDWQSTNPTPGAADWRVFMDSTFTPDLQTRTDFDDNPYNGSGFEWDALKRGIQGGSGTNDSALAYYEVTANALAGPGVTAVEDDANDLLLAEKAAAQVRKAVPGVSVTAKGVDELQPSDYGHWDPGDEVGVRVTGVLDFGSEIKYAGCERTADVTRVETTDDSTTRIPYLVPIPIIRRRRKQTDDATSEQVAASASKQEALAGEVVGWRESAAVAAAGDDRGDGAGMAMPPAQRKRRTLPSLPSLRMPKVELPRPDLDLSPRGRRIGRLVLSAVAAAGVAGLAALGVSEYKGAEITANERLGICKEAGKWSVRFCDGNPDAKDGNGSESRQPAYTGPEVACPDATTETTHLRTFVYRDGRYIREENTDQTKPR